MSTGIEDLVVDGKPISEWTIDQHNEALDTLGAHVYKPFGGVLVVGRGSRPYTLKVRKQTAEGEVTSEVVDGLACYSAVPFGHGDPVITEAVKGFLDEMATIPRSISHSFLGPWLVKLREYTGMDMFLPKNGGTEANEAAIKICRKWGKKHGGPNGTGIEGTPVLLSATGCFHGRGLGSTSLMDDAASREGLEPLLPGCEHVPYNDIEAIRDAIERHDGNVAAIILEPIQAEAGVYVPDPDYLRNVQALAREKNVLFVLDEIQTGFGRTGANFAWQQLGLQPPDLMTIGKAMSSGVLPISCLCGRQDLMELFVPHSEGSTFGGYPLAAFVGLLTIAEMERRDIPRMAAERGEYLRGVLNEVAKKHADKVVEVRGVGMLIGVELHPSVDGHALSERILEHGVYIKETHQTNMRIAPPIVIDEEGMQAIGKAFDVALSEL